MQNERQNGFEELWATSAESESSTTGTAREREKRISAGNESNIKSFYSRLFCSIIDNMSDQIKARYSSLSKLELFQLLWHAKYSEYRRKFPTKGLQKLQAIYGPLFDYIRLENELYVLYRADDFAKKPVHELMSFIKLMDFQSAFSEVYKLCQLISTIPSNTAFAERTFSDLKRINTCFRSNQNQIRLSGLSLLAFEKGILAELKSKNLLYDLTIEQLLSQKRRMELTYK